ncbi:undecaprenyl-phosphate glucose phosphotransferase [Shewanella sp. BF02_Schw]|uniref:undecaprenyl-phosphate glucose phosphotransferase n=1 Tax=Shewanella sp. BF02_Schw TaxID=394908 RepID=UPI0017825FD3|nr:undecaprenyl-phosphate glucose phosphotransferase [Shewanella sp. BF02_Schw]MBO1894950.1 undecaprenyl-phosphate glucose phosphotransferase [Shewanella sp. BF02_Schw]|tara:strand:- start:178 stop:1578 length:1401 start_codon:yes stop_codon:yes gene_type:complete
MDSRKTLDVEKDSYTFLYRLIDILIIIICFNAALLLYGAVFSKDYLIVLIFTLLVYSYLSESFQLYRSWRVGKFSRMISSLFLVKLFCFFIVASSLFLLKESETFSRIIIVGWFTLSIICLMTWRFLAKWIKSLRRRSGFGFQDVAIVGLTSSGINLYREILKNYELGFKFVGFFDDREPKRLGGMQTTLIEGGVNEAVALAKNGKIQKLYICLPMVAEKRIADIIEQLGNTTVDVLITPDFLLKNLMQARIGSVGDVDTISVFESPVNGMRRFYKRTFDIIFSLTAILALSPVLVIIGAAIKLNSPGAVIFKQDRYGLDGRKIKVWKFRSMTVTENSDVVTQATKGDTRITKVGAFLRKTSLDELPQFFNVFKGDMSVVGPRPHAVAHNEEYRKLVTYYMLRHKVLPGITGWAQVNGWRGETDTLNKMEKRIEYDLAYIRNWTLWWDIKIVFMTIFKGFVGKNVY